MKTFSGDDSYHPQGTITFGGDPITKGGATLRQEFASRFLAAIISAKQGTNVNRSFIADAISYADLLIDELNNFGEDEN